MLVSIHDMELMRGLVDLRSSLNIIALWIREAVEIPQKVMVE